MIPYAQSQAIIGETRPLPKISIPTRQAAGYVSSQEVRSPMAVPSFTNSAMDGFAVRSADLAKATQQAPVTMAVAGSTMAGDVPEQAAGGAWEIMTGAIVPEGYDAVIKVEDVTITAADAGGRAQQVSFTTPAQPQENIRRAGEDFVAGSAVLSSGTLLDSYHVMALAAVGQAQIEVYSKPRVTVFNTGKEVTDALDSPLQPGQIYNSNGPYLMAALRGLPVEPHYGGGNPDAPERFAAQLEEALPASDIIISTGAVSAGQLDFIPDSLRRLGAQIMFHKVAIRPGKPILYARCPDGTHYFGLSGNPISTAVGLRFFVMSLLRRLQGMAPEMPLQAALAQPLAAPAGLRMFLKGHVQADAAGKLQLQILPGQESFKISPMLQANCWVCLEERREGAAAGGMLNVFPLQPNVWQLGVGG